MPGDRRSINRRQSRSNRLASTASACRSLIFIAAPSCSDAALTLNRFRSGLGRLRQSFAGLCPTVALLCLTFAAAAFKSGERPSQCRQPPGNLPARLSIGSARPAKRRPAPAKYLGRLTDGRASLPECRFWSSVDRRPLLDYRRSSFVGGASPKNCRPASFVRQRRLFECRRSMFEVRSR
jgi:hypothetical protein